MSIFETEKDLDNVLYPEPYDVIKKLNEIKDYYEKVWEKYSKTPVMTISLSNGETLEGKWFQCSYSHTEKIIKFYDDKKGNYIIRYDDIEHISCYILADDEL